MHLLNPWSLDQNDLSLADPAGNDPLAERLELLAGTDRLIAEMRLKNRLSFRQIGLKLGIVPGHVSRRMRQLDRRLRDPIVRALAENRPGLIEAHRRIGLEFFLHRQSALAIARRRGLSREQVRLVLAYIRGWFAAQQKSPANSSIHFEDRHEQDE